MDLAHISMRRVLEVIGASVILVALLYLPRLKEGTRLEPLAPLPASATNEERLAYAEAVTERSTVGERIELRGCKPDIEYAKFVLGSKIIFYNKDNATRTVAFSPAIWIDIPAREERSFAAGTIQYRGIWPYSCDSMPSGTVVITI